MPPHPIHAARGFTLLEVLVALVIALLATGMLFSGALAGLRSTQISAHAQEALARARSHLAVVGIGAAIVPGDQTGDDGGGFSWRLHIVPAASAPAGFGDSDLAHAPRVVLYDVAVTISWHGDGAPRAVALRSQRVGLIAAAPP